MTTDSELGGASTTRLFVFSHPNHELAVFGLARRLRPYLVFLTDGGGEHRVAETRRGLESIALADRARFLGHTEQSFYDALLRRDRGFFDGVTAEVRQAIDDVAPEQVFADAVELYNPVHDMTLPVAVAAVRATPGVGLFEVPLVYQRPGDGERYEVQRMPPSCGARRIDVALADDEIAAKEHARDAIYRILMQQMGPVLATLPREHLAIEQVAMAEPRLAHPGSERALRYEWRGELLRNRGEVSDVITYAKHYAPVASAFLGSERGRRVGDASAP
jgi:hypothetical protein